MPAPASSCGTTVQAMLGAGRKASAAAPPASSTAPASARARAGPGMAARRERAAIGRIETPSAARSGEIANPATSSITSRKSTAVNAAAVSASAARLTGEASPHCTGGRDERPGSGPRSSSMTRARSMPVAGDVRRRGVQAAGLSSRTWVGVEARNGAGSSRRYHSPASGGS